MQRLYLLILILVILIPCIGISQQQAAWSSFYENGFIWNPALTARWNTWEASVVGRQEWIGFEGAPKMANIGFQYPFVKRFTKVAAGGYLNYDEVGPFQSVTGGGTYAYKIRPQLFGNRKDVLTFGGRLSFGQYRFTDSKAVTFSGEFDPTVIPDQTGLLPDVGVGLYYVTISDIEIHKSHYYFGLAANNLISSQINTGPLGSYTNIPHVSAHGGYRFYPFGQTDVFYEPNVFVSYGFNKAVNVMGNFRYEWVDRFWLAGGAVSSGEVFGQMGFIFNRESVLGAIVGDGVMRIGAKVDYSLGSLRRYAGMGFETYIAYLFSNEPY